MKDSPASYLPALCRLRKKIYGLGRSIREAVQRSPSDASLDGLRQTKDNTENEFKTLQKSFREAKQHAETKALQALRDMIERNRKKDPHSFFGGVNSIAPLEGSHQDTQARPDPEVVLKHFTEVLKEDRGPVKAMDGSWDRYIPVAANPAAGEHIMAPITAAEVYLAMGFMANKKLLGLIKPCSPGCKQCNDFNTALEAWDPKNPAQDPPLYRPSLGTCVSGGSDGITSDMLRFARHPEPDKRFHSRMRFTGALATMFNRWLKEGTPTTSDFAHAVLTALLKRALPGFFADPRNPKDTRAIAGGNTIPKIFSLVLLRRLSHWGINEGIISPEQIGFMPHLGSEMHVYSAIETLKLARKLGTHVGLLLLDVQGAYDNVYREALWYILKRTGLPASFVTMLSGWYSRRTASVKVGNEVSEPFPTTRGEPQGDVLSPFLWNIFFEPLLRKLAAETPGLTLRGPESQLTVKQQAYADDLAVFCGGNGIGDIQSKTQKALDIAVSWASDWGARINTKMGKTEAMYFDPAGDDSVDPRLTPLNAGPSPDGSTQLNVQWTREYRYLGFPLTLSLDTRAYVNKRMQLLQLAYYRYFRFNRLIYRLSIASQMQIANCLCLGQVNYLLSILPVDGRSVRKLETVMRDIGRSILRLPAKVPNALVDCEMIGFPAKVLILSQSFRVLETLRLLEAPFNRSPAARMLAFTRTLNDKTTFCARVEADLEKVRISRTRPGEAAVPSAILERATSLAGVHAAVTKFKRTASFSWTWAHHPRSTIFKHTRTGEDVRRIALERALDPPSLPASEHLASVYGVGLFPDIEDVGRYPQSTPMSCTVGGWSSGSLLHASSTRHPNAAVILSRLGRHAYDFSPFKSKTERRGDRECDQDFFKFKYNVPGDCPLCGSERDDPRHLYCECSHPLLAAKRTELVDSLRTMIAALMSSVKRTADYGGPHPDTNAELVRLASAITTLVGKPLENRKDLNFVLFRMMLALPFSSKAVSAKVAKEPMPLASTVARTFDLLVARNHWTRNQANIIVAWANKWVTTFVELRKQLLTTPNNEDGSQQQPGPRVLSN